MRLDGFKSFLYSTYKGSLLMKTGVVLLDIELKRLHYQGSV